LTRREELVRELARRRERGVVSVEFLIVSAPFFIVLMGVMQYALAAVARVSVEYSAFAAARAAVVWLPREEAGTGGDPSTAAAFPLIPLSPAVDHGKVSVSEYLGNSQIMSQLVARAGYARQATVVDITPEHPGWNDDVTVQVAYLYSCKVPIGKQIMCRRFADLPSDMRGRFSGAFPGWYLVMRASHTLTNQGRPS
jgi:Flp pilus assembly protein TadG